jgi:arginase
MDVLDPAVMPAVDAPEPGGIAFPELELLLAGLVDTPDCLGVEITVFDPDYDPDGEYAEEITSTIVAGLAAARTVARPDLVQARAESVEDEEPDAFAEFHAAQADAFAQRRAAAAADSVSLAAEGMSDGPVETALPATTLIGVEEDPPAASDDGDTHDADADDGDNPGRPLGSAPLLDSEPLPATRPGMLRPRPAEDPRTSEGFSLPAQRPAFDVGPGEPADIA